MVNVIRRFAANKQVPEFSADVVHKITRVFINIFMFSSALLLVRAKQGRISSLASGHFCRLLITFAISLDPDQDRQHVGPDIDPNCLTDSVPDFCLFIIIIFLLLKKLIWKKVSRRRPMKHNDQGPELQCLLKVKEDLI